MKIGLSLLLDMVHFVILLRQEYKLKNSALQANRRFDMVELFYIIFLLMYMTCLFINNMRFFILSYAASYYLNIIVNPIDFRTMMRSC